MKGVAIVSGGLDSTTMIYHLLDQGHELHLLSFDYGQRHRKELKFAQASAQNLGLRWDLVNLTGLTHLISNSALTSPTTTAYDMDVIAGDTIHRLPHDPGGQRAVEVPEGHYAEENMKQTVVPNRNMIMLSIAAGVAVNEKANFVAVGVHAGDHFVYPDCRPNFIFSVGKAILDGTGGFHNFWHESDTIPDEEKEQIRALGQDPEKLRFVRVIDTPFLHWTKADIAYRALELGVPLHLTWSCYKGGEKHCGRCGTCVERLEAIDGAIIRYTGALAANTPQDIARYDQTEYMDTEYWRQAVREAMK